MEKLKKIKKGTNDNAFDWLFNNETYVRDVDHTKYMIRQLIANHNQMVDYIDHLEKKFNGEDLKRGEELVCLNCGKDKYLNAMTLDEGLCTCLVKTAD